MDSLTVKGAISLVVLAAALAMWMHRMVAREGDAVIRRLLVAGLLAKMASSVARYVVVWHVYGRGDAFRYLSVGSRVAEELRSGVIPPSALATGTASMEFLSGVVFLVMEPTPLVGFAVFSTLSFVGCILTLRAFTLGFPDGDRRRFAALVLLTPTMLFWPSSLGKDAWLVFCLGVGSLGVARLLRRRAGGYVLIAVGVAGAYLIRPHMGALLIVAAAVAFALRFRDPDLSRGAVAWLVGMVLVAAGAGFVLVNFTDELLPPDQIAAGGGLNELLEETEERTAGGGSEFAAQPVTSLGDLPAALVTVPFRPFPWEAGSGLALLTSLEGVLMLGLVVASYRRLLRLPRTVMTRPFVAFAATYTLGFVIAFSTVGNFGILARQRSQLVPLMAVVLSLPLEARGDEREHDPVGRVLVDARVRGGRP